MKPCRRIFDKGPTGIGSVADRVRPLDDYLGRREVGKDNGMYEVNVRWVGNQQYVAEGHEGRHAIVLDIPEKSGGADTGLHATELLLIAVGKCSAVDVVNILRKQRVELRSLRVVVSGEISKDYPKYYERIHMKFIVSGDGVTEEKVAKAISLSHGRYCTVSLSLSDKCDLTTSVEITDQSCVG